MQSIGFTLPSGDIIYVSLLLISVAIGNYYRKIQDPYTKQWICTLTGLTLVFIVSGSFTIHPLFVTLVNAIIITQLSPKMCHLVSFFFSFFYLLIIFRLGDWCSLPTPPGHTNLIQMMITIKLSGLAFEINSASTVASDDLEGVNSAALKKIKFIDVFHYAFSYMGVLTGPYYRYRTYWDSLHRPFGNYADPWPITRYKLIQTGLFIVLFVIMNYLYPSKYTLTEEYAERSFLYRFFYIYPAFYVFKLRMFSGMILAECACQMSGVGVYPLSSKPSSGLGPRDYKRVETLTTDIASLKQESFDYETTHNMNVWELEKCMSVRTAMKMWNTCMQYWMATCIYKRFPHKGLRTVVTLTVSALWHGYAAGYYFCICQIPLYLPMEDIYIKYYKQLDENSFTRKVLQLFLAHMRQSCMAYLGIPFLLLDLYEIIHFYKSLYFAGHILIAVLYVYGRIFLVKRISKETNAEIKAK